MNNRNQGMRITVAAMIVAVAVAVGALVAIAQNGSDPETAAVDSNPSTANSTDVGDSPSPDSANADSANQDVTDEDSTDQDSGSNNSTPNETNPDSDDGETTAASTTTTEDVQPDAVSGPIDIVIDRAVIGGWANGAWRETTVEPPDYGGTTFTYFSTPVSERAAGPLTRPFCEFIPDGPGWELDIELGSETVVNTIGVSNLSWDPRASDARPTEASPERAVSIANVLSANGLDGVTPSIDAATILDIDGDGANEVILEASNGQPDFYGSRVGDYSVIVMRWVNESEEVEEVVLGSHVTTGNEVNVEPNPDAPDGVISVFSTYYEVVGAADLNGDGDIEIIVGFSGWEYWGYQVIDIDGRSADVVLEISCGV